MEAIVAGQNTENNLPSTSNLAKPKQSKSLVAAFSISILIFFGSLIAALGLEIAVYFFVSVFTSNPQLFGNQQILRNPIFGYIIGLMPLYIPLTTSLLSAFFLTRGSLRNFLLITSVIISFLIIGLLFIL